MGEDDVFFLLRERRQLARVPKRLFGMVEQDGTAIMLRTAGIIVVEQIVEHGGAGSCPFVQSQSPRQTEGELCHAQSVVIAICTAVVGKGPQTL